MEALSLTFAGGIGPLLSVRTFDVREALNQPYEVSLVARAPQVDVDFEALIGEAASFALHGGVLHSIALERRFTGICIHCEQLRVEPSGLSTYAVTLVPRLWLLGQRRNHRLWQHRSVVQIAHELLGEWEVPHRLDLDRERHPPLELRMQYGESDLAFLGRLLEEAGISYGFEHDPDRGSVMVLRDEPQAVEPRLPITYVDDPTAAQVGGQEFITELSLRRDMRPGRVVLRDFDFRKPRYELVADARAEDASETLEEALEQYHYLPGAFLTEGHDHDDTPAADDLGVARADLRAGQGLAERILDGERSRRRTVAFRTNAYDVGPGSVIAVSGHPRADLSVDRPLLVLEMHLTGDAAAGEWAARGKAVFADIPYRPALATKKPTITGVQSAIVVGPREETVFTDEFGRVRVQFHWDRSGQFDPGSSCWLRVSQAWAGPGYGLFNLPRVGHEVLVGFVEGDPDQPIVVGRVFNGAQQVPYPLPGSKMLSGWKTDSNSNIILFDDTPGDEMFYEQAERNRLGIVKRNEAYLTAGSRTTYLGTAERTLIGTTATRVALASHKTLTGITNAQTSVISWKAQAGFGATMKAGNKVEHVVVPVMPFLTALRDLDDAQILIEQKLPGGTAPDLQQVLPAYAGGPNQSGDEAVAMPAMSQSETEAALKETLSVVGQAVAQFEPEEVEAMAEAESVQAAVDAMLGSLQQKGGAQAVTALKSAKQLTKQLQALSQPAEMNTKQGPKQQQQQNQKEPSSMFEKLLATIVEAVLPKTKITIKHQKITLETKDASIEIDGEDIKLEAKGDITLKADGKVKIEGSCVDISPSPCKCG